MAEGCVYLCERDKRSEEIRKNTAELLALRTTDHTALAQMLAKNCVKRGVRWLNRNAPNPGWWRNCLDGGRSRVFMSHDNSGILALAFEYEEHLANEFGYVTDNTVLRKFGFNIPILNLHATRLGFIPWSWISGWTPFPERYPDVVITSETLTTEWKTFLENPPSGMRINYRHENKRLAWIQNLVDRETPPFTWREFGSVLSQILWPPNWFKKSFWYGD